MRLEERVTDTAIRKKATAVSFAAVIVISVVAVGFALVPTTATASSLASSSADDIVGTTPNCATDTMSNEAGEGDSVFNVSNLTPPGDTAAALDDTLAITATVENTGDTEDTQTVEYRIGDNVIASQNVTLGPGKSTTVAFEDLNVSDLDAGEYEHGVFTDDDSETADLRLDAPVDRVVVDRVDSDNDTDNSSQVEKSVEGRNDSTHDGAPGLGALSAFVALITAALLSTRPSK